MLPMAACSPFKDDDCIGWTFSHEQRANQIQVIAVGGERIEPHRPFDPRNSRLRITQKGEVNAALHDQTWIIGIKCQRTLQMVLALGILPLHERDTTHDSVALSVVRIDAHRSFEQFNDLLENFGSARPEFAAQRLA